jgi:uncharacterized protein
MSGRIEFAIGAVSMKPAPITPEWILDGCPVARNALLSSSEDGSAFSLIWDCTAGKFEWRYDIDETVYVLEGEVRIVDDAGVPHHVRAGDSVFFPAGTRATWTIDSYIRKVAFCRKPAPRAYVQIKALAKSALRALGLRKAGPAQPAMFGNLG